MIQIVVLDLVKLGRLCGLETYFTKRTADGCGIFVFVGSNRGTENILLCLVIALLAYDVCECIKLLFCLINLVLEFGKGSLEVTHLLFLLVFLLLIQGP